MLNLTLRRWPAAFRYSRRAAGPRDLAQRKPLQCGGLRGGEDRVADIAMAAMADPPSLRDAATI